MSDLKLAIILGSTRPGRNGEAVANWVLAKAKERANADYELIDLVSYGSLGGTRAIEHLRAISSELQLAHVRQQLSFSLLTDFENFSVFKPAAIHDSAASVLFGQLESWAGALKSVRS
ncbi:NADPH-dependent FMN reductase [Streptomyces sp. 5-10]|uniref:NADPH-dependent FMN reductase n=1 Tax=Streptomyces sp. 5-10 TaxID=878925 RepID=UPI00168BAD98|nr:NAD(P)H-dependent oxidoreductase [Streptomyces sp. 5-10]MBD3007292.1 NAD(P)H-dependent oxidoreductase [Streptomyces sp. 5-10]